MYTPWTLKQPFLQGSEITRDIYIRPPSEAQCKGKVWKLCKCVYGLADASLSWYNRVCEVIKQCKGQISQVDPAVFYWKNKAEEVNGVLACHVDDFLWAGSDDFETYVINKIKARFSVGQEHSQQDGTFPYIGIELSYYDSGICLSQKGYLKNLHTIPLDKNRMIEKDAPLRPKEQEALQSKIGQILWVARQSRPDIIFEASHLASSLKKASVKTIMEANKVIKKLKYETVEL